MLKQQNQMKGRIQEEIWFFKTESRKGKPIDPIDSSHSDSTTLDVGVFPAHAGVFLDIIAIKTSYRSFPRSRGGVFHVYFPKALNSPPPFGESGLIFLSLFSAYFTKEAAASYTLSAVIPKYS